MLRSFNCCSATIVAVIVSLLLQEGLSANPALVSQLPEKGMPPLDTVLRNAMTRSEEMIENHWVMEKAKAERRIGKSRLMPKAGLNGSLRREDVRDLPGNDVDERVIMDLSLTQPLYHWGALAADKETYDLLDDIARIQSQNSYRLLALSLRSQYLNLVLQNQELTHAQASLELERAQLALSRKRHEDGQLPEATLRSLETSFSQEELALRERELTFGYALEDFSIRAGASLGELRSSMPRSIPQAQPLSPDTISSLAQLSHLALNSSGELKALLTMQEIQQRGYEIADKRLYPKINLRTGITQNERDVNGRIREDELFFAGINVNWDIFDGFETSGYRKAALAKVRLAEEKVGLYRERLGMAMERSVSTLQVAAASLRLAELLLDEAKAWFEESKRGLEQGEVSEAGFAQAEQQLRQRDIQTQKDRVRYLNALSSMVSLLGLDPYVSEYAQSYAGN